MYNNVLDEMYRVSESKSRIICNFNDNWRFFKLAKKDGSSSLEVESESFDDSLWEEVNLPHTWNSSDGASGRTGITEGGENYYRGLSAYRKRFVLPNEFSGKRIFIEFAGANTVAEVFVNGSFAGKHEGGYSAFRFDITGFLKFDDENIIAVKVNNAPTDCIAPITDQGDFTKMGGIYRNVRLIAVEAVHIDLMDFGSSGIYVTPKNISESFADIDILVKLENDSSENKSITVSAEIRDMSGSIVASAKNDISINAKDISETLLKASVENPVLWNGRENPYLYSAEIKIISDGVEVDKFVQSFGIRTYSIDPEKGFFLNGKYLDLRGTNYHQDSFENGWAMTDEQRERDFRMMLDMGCTSVRMAHYQHCRHEYELCDRLGITVWTEIGIVNKMSPSETADNIRLAEGFAENAKQQLTELIRQNYNHPSVIVWGISNELYQMTDEIFDLYVELNTLAHNEDKTRLTTYADNQSWGRFMELPPDVLGYNRYFGWYKDAGEPENFGPWLDSYHGVREKRPICISEYGGGGAISQHKDNIDWQSDIDPWGERHYENYQSELHERVWAQLSQRKYLWGKYIWCMFDFASDGREEGDTKGQNDKGLVTRNRIPKDSYYFYKSVWNSEPMVHLTEKRFAERPCTIPRVKVYSNAVSAELFVNGTSMGTAESQSGSTVFVWENIKINCGKENIISVQAKFSDGSVIEDNAVWTGC